MKKITLLPLIGMALFALTDNQVHAETFEQAKKIRFEARCAADNPKKVLVVVDDTCYYMADLSVGGFRQQDFGIASNDEGVVGVYKKDYEQGRELLKNVPPEYQTEVNGFLIYRSGRPANHDKMIEELLLKGKKPLVTLKAL